MKGKISTLSVSPAIHGIKVCFLLILFLFLLLSSSSSPSFPSSPPVMGRSSSNLGLIHFLVLLLFFSPPFHSFLFTQPNMVNSRMYLVSQPIQATYHIFHSLPLRKGKEKSYSAIFLPLVLFPFFFSFPFFLPSAIIIVSLLFVNYSFPTIWTTRLSLV